MNVALALFYGEGSQLWAFISQSFLDKNTKFLCSLDWKFPEFFKTPPTFIFRPLPRPVMGILQRITLFLGQPVELGQALGIIVMFCLPQPNTSFWDLVGIEGLLGHWLGHVSIVLGQGFKYDLWYVDKGQVQKQEIKFDWYLKGNDGMKMCLLITMNGRDI